MASWTGSRLTIALYVPMTGRTLHDEERVRMKLFAQLADRIKAYPYRKRLPLAITMLCVFGWITYKSGPYPSEIDRSVDLTGTAALSLVFFFGYRGRPFWFFCGVALGAFLVEHLAKLHLGR